jgi:4-amino-4-deoxy-L-arabinose transferase-like glycosyltransferase
MGYYLQQGNLSYFDANFSAQVLHPKNATLLLSYAYLVSGRNENALQLVQFISYWVAVCSVYAISRKAGNDRTRSVFAATVCGLLTEWLMQATTTQNDMILTAFFGVSAYALLASGRERRSKYLILAALGVGLALGTKATAFLPLVSIGLIASYALLTAKPRSLRRDSAILSASTLVAVCVFVLPSGYVDNYSRFGSPVGPQQVKAEHVFENAGQVAVHGTKNVFRYGFDFLKLDGLPRFGIVRTTQTIMRAFPKRVVRALGVDLESPAATVAPFRYSKAPAAHEDRSQWGVLGFGLVWLAALLSMLGVIKSPAVRVLSIAAVLLFLFRVYVGPYDPWRGRHLITCALFAAPAVGALLPAKNGFVRAYLLLVVIVGCLSAVSAVVLRDDGGLVSFRDRGRACAASVFRLDRIGQLTRNDTSYCEAIRRYDSLVPSNATVAVSLLGGSYEYPLFGRRLTRTIIPVNSFEKGLQPIPSTADYLLYEPDAFPCASPDDMHLGVDWYLRRLTGGTPVSAVSGSES